MGLIIGLVSICLNIIAFYWILLLTQRVKVLEESAGQADASLIQEQLEAHLQALRNENVRTIEEIEVLVSKQPPFLVETDATPKADPPSSPKEVPPQPTHVKVEPKEETKWEPPLDLETPIDVMETSLLSHILQLQEEGLNTEKIAKRLGIGKGEVALMLKLHTKK